MYAWRIFRQYVKYSVWQSVASRDLPSFRSGHCGTKVDLIYLAVQWWYDNFTVR